MNVWEGCATTSDNSGNLLFYTSGTTVYNQAHSTMSNGTGLNGSGTPCQSSLILKQPGNNNNYFIFTVQDVNSPIQGAYYSIVDMNLSAGMGSVTIKNATLTTTSQSERITATKHCNGIDYWILLKDQGQFALNPQFRAFLLSAGGISTVAITSNIAPWGENGTGMGCMKISCLKIGLTPTKSSNFFGFELYDFDNTTGIVSNPLALHNGNPLISTNGAYGCEFSPDGTKLYGTRPYNVNLYNGTILQWDLCAGSPAAIAASQTAISTQSVAADWHGFMQLAPNGKIYIARTTQSAISVINNPNIYGSGCGFTYMSQSISTGTCYYGLPNFPTFYFQTTPALHQPFTFSTGAAYGCQTASFSLPGSVLNYNISGCSSAGYSLTGHMWNFGDPLSGANNTSIQNNPQHVYSIPGTYTAQLILYYSCGGGTDTLKQAINISNPCISISSTSITCASLGSATATPINSAGPFSYTWTPSNQTSSVASGLKPGTYTLTAQNLSNNAT